LLQFTFVDTESVTADADVCEIVAELIDGAVLSMAGAVIAPLAERPLW
jgi:hypothetical protein